MQMGYRHLKITCGPFHLNLEQRPHIMGIINLTDDSFSDGGQYNTPQKAFVQARRLKAEGADILDLGAESTRPGAKPVSAQQELQRLLPAFKRIVTLGLPISIDTYKPEVARAMAAAGAHMLNDVTGGRNPEMLRVMAQAKVPVVLMHMRGTPQTMQKAPRYHNVVAEVKASLKSAAQAALAAGVLPRNIILDPGIGFGKTLNHNLQLIRELGQLIRLGYPVLVGPSRKSFIGKLLGNLPPPQRDWGTAAAVSLSVAAGAHLLRVHAVSAMAMVSRVAAAITKGQAVGGIR